MTDGPTDRRTDRPTDRPTKLGTEAPSPELKNEYFVFICNNEIKTVILIPILPYIDDRI